MENIIGGRHGHGSQSLAYSQPNSQVACNSSPQRTLNDYAGDLRDRLNNLVSLLANVVDRIDGPTPMSMEKSPDSKIPPVPNLVYTFGQIEQLLREADHLANTLILRV